MSDSQVQTPVNRNAERDVVFIDAYNLIYRAYYGNQRPLTSPSGLPTNALYTVTRMLINLRASFPNIAYALAVFDGGGNFRTELDAEYKANRKEMPEDLKVQMPYLKDLFKILGWPIYQAENVEADDVIGTLASRAAAKGFRTHIISSDKDFRQIVTDNLHVVDTMQDIRYNREKVFEKMGVYPENVPAWLALVGDTTDNVAGVDKIAVKTAAKLLTTYNDIQGLIQNAHEVKGVVGENLRAAIENGQLLKSLELVTLKLDLQISLSKDELTLKEKDDVSWLAFCETMGFKTFANNPSPKF